jgi:hypothetical protein
MRAQRRKTVTWELFQANVHSPPFFGQNRQILLFFFFYFRTDEREIGCGKIKTTDYTNEKTKKMDKKEEEKNTKEKHG